MTTRLLVAYASRHGSTREVAEAIAAALRGHGLDAEVRAAAHVRGLEGYAGVVLGAAIYVGRLHGDARAFMRRHRRALAALPLAVFALGPRTLAAGEVAASRSQLDAALAREPTLRPFSTAIFGGVVKPSELRFPLNRMPATDARDWDAIRRWADEIAARFALAPGAVV